jgi:hypothetical protein
MRVQHKGISRRTVSSRVIRLRRNFCVQGSRQPDGTNVLGRVHIPIMMLTAFLTLPAPNRQRLGLSDVPASGAPLRGRKPPVDLDHASPFGFVFDVAKYSMYWTSVDQPVSAILRLTDRFCTEAALASRRCIPFTFSVSKQIVWFSSTSLRLSV